MGGGGGGGLQYMLFLMIHIYQSFKRWEITSSWDKCSQYRNVLFTSYNCFKKPFRLINDNAFSIKTKSKVKNCL